MKSLLNTSATIFSNILGYILLMFVPGWLIGGLFPSFNRIVVTLIYGIFWGFYTFLIIRARMPFNDGLSPEQGANVFSWVLALLATGFVFLTARAGQTFFLATVLTFGSVVIIHAVIVYQNQDIVRDGSLLEILLVRSNRKIVEKLRQDLKNNPSERPRSEYLADLTFSIFNTSGVITGAITLLMYQLGWFVQGR